ncbi:hypothetical protein [Vibrio parahaemolyticus]|uniref:hypothetical protein n=1 Tax=Vibrio parahaemolyticus TaxID=670 RepID=UPI00111F81D5|nr:hypothetical protein [Vibrio parahaemolyticus]QNE59133.1 hypothetical protein H5404_25390 [Vibrio parahaemolyticus]TNY96424.1 hypothetical protein CGK56_24185 [Vibrio parahaemolyticus]
MSSNNDQYVKIDFISFMDEVKKACDDLSNIANAKYMVCMKPDGPQPVKVSNWKTKEECDSYLQGLKDADLKNFRIMILDTTENACIFDEVITNQREWPKPWPGDIYK